MMEGADMGKLLIVVGSLILIVGLLTTYAPLLINWFGKLPGDIHIKNEHSTVFIPFTSMIVTCFVLSTLLNLFFRK